MAGALLVAAPPAAADLGSELDAFESTYLNGSSAEYRAVSDNQRRRARTAFERILRNHSGEPLDERLVATAYRTAMGTDNPDLVHNLNSHYPSELRNHQNTAVEAAAEGMRYASNQRFASDNAKATPDRTMSDIGATLGSLLKDYASKDALDRTQAFTDAFMKGDGYDTMKPLLDLGLDPNFRTDETIDDLSSRGGDVAAGSTLLHFAAYARDDTAVEALLKLGLDPTVKNQDGKTAADIAREEDLPQIAAILDEATAVIEEKKRAAQKKVPPAIGKYTQVVYALQPANGLPEPYLATVAHDTRPCEYSAPECTGIMALHIDLEHNKYGVVRANDQLAVTVTMAGVFASVIPAEYQKLPTSEQLAIAQNARKIVDGAAAKHGLLTTATPTRPNAPKTVAGTAQKMQPGG